MTWKILAYNPLTMFQYYSILVFVANWTVNMSFIRQFESFLNQNMFYFIELLFSVLNLPLVVLAHLLVLLHLLLSFDIVRHLNYLLG